MILLVVKTDSIINYEKRAQAKINYTLTVTY